MTTKELSTVDWRNTDKDCSETPPFVTISEALKKLYDLTELTPRGGSLLGKSMSYFRRGIFIIDGKEAWRIGICIEIPLFSNMICAQLANWRLPFSYKRIEFVVKANANAMRIGAIDEPGHLVHSYILLNGSFQQNQDTRYLTEMFHSKPFRDREVRESYDNNVYHSDDFNKILAVMRSELSGSPAFPRVGDSSRGI